MAEPQLPPGGPGGIDPVFSGVKPITGLPPGYDSAPNLALDYTWDNSYDKNYRPDYNQQ
jgi:hypothetical protein